MALKKLTRQRIILGSVALLLLTALLSWYLTPRFVFGLFANDGSLLEIRILRSSDSLSPIMPIVERELTKLEPQKESGNAILYWGIATFVGFAPSVANRSDFDAFLNSWNVRTKYSPNRIQYRESMYFLEYQYEGNWLHNSGYKYKQFVGVSVAGRVRQTKGLDLDPKNSGARVLQSVEWNDLDPLTRDFSKYLFQ